MHIKLLHFVFRRTVRTRAPNAVKNFIPLAVELSQRGNLTPEHIQSMCSTMLQTEAATIAVQIVVIIIRMQKFIKR